MTALYLASGSPRRRELLTLLDIPFERLRVDVIEQRAAHETAEVYVRRLAQDKAQDKAQAGVAAAPQDLPVLRADTIMVLEGQVLEKTARRSPCGAHLIDAFRATASCDDCGHFSLSSHPVQRTGGDRRDVSRAEAAGHYPLRCQR